MTIMKSLWLLFVAVSTLQVVAFSVHPASNGIRPSTCCLQAQVGDDPELLLVKNHLADNYPQFSALLEKNDRVWKALSGAEGGFTIFVPNAAAYQAMGDTKCDQLLDVRNLETSEKIGAYHVIASTVSAEALFQAGGVITQGGEVPVERSVTGGMFGMGGKEDGGVTINGAKVVKSVPLGNGLLHEVDALISPNILWRYMDQLRIPGSK